MMEHLTRYAYAYLMVFTIFFPFALSFDDKVAFYRNWRYLALPLLLSAAFYIIWDAWFTQMGVWHFNYAHLLGPQLLGLPLEEWLFFIIVPYACVFVYECYRCYTPERLRAGTLKIITLILIISLLAIGLFNLHRWYTSVTLVLTSIGLAAHYALFGTRYLENVYIGWLICLIPFFLVNGVLTALPVVVYNDVENLGIRLYTIPVEDTFYGFLLYLLIVSGMEWNRREVLVSGMAVPA